MTVVNGVDSDELRAAADHLDSQPGATRVTLVLPVRQVAAWLRGTAILIDKSRIGDLIPGLHLTADVARAVSADPRDV